MPYLQQKNDIAAAAISIQRSATLTEGIASILQQQMDQSKGES
jgi:hypothetical protein